jgi:hypothetical protein
MPWVLVSDVGLYDPIRSTRPSFPAKASAMWFLIFVLDVTAMVDDVQRMHCIS